MQKLDHAELAALIQRVQQGDMEAFSELYEATVSYQLYSATAILRNSVLAEDVVQEVYISLYKSIRNLRNPKGFVAYMNRICRNLCIDHLRRAQQSDLLINKLALTDDLLNETDIEYFSKIELQSDLCTAISNLPDSLRVAVYLRYYSEMKLKEIAMVMKCSESTVKRYLKAALTQLSQELSANT